MNTKLTASQLDAMKALAEYKSGEWVSFGSGLRRRNVSLRALHHRAKTLVQYQAKDGEEYFSITEAGRASLNPVRSPAHD